MIRYKLHIVFLCLRVFVAKLFPPLISIDIISHP